jgi:hypothetical protein
MAWLGGWLWIGSMATLVFVLLLFPDGKPLSPRWKPMVWVAGVGLAALLAPFLFKRGQLDMDQQYPVANPFGVHGWDAFFETIQAAGLVVYFLTVVAATIGLVVRANRSTGVERQQVKWLGYAGVFLVFMVFAGSVIGPPAGALLGDELVYNVSLFLFGLAVAGIPTATGVAIFRHHLYDIDVIINRTLVYGALTAVLAVVYVVGVVGVGGILRQVGGQESNSLAVTASTLAVAALFRPARGRVQAFIDRRFYRGKYDAARTLEHFSTRLREEIDLESLSTELLCVVQDTMQPTQISLWLREREGRTRQLA